MKCYILQKVEEETLDVKSAGFETVSAASIRTRSSLGT